MAMKSTSPLFISVLLLACLLSDPSQAADHKDLVFLHYWTGALSGGINEMTQAFNKAHPQSRVRATGFEHESFKVGIQVMLSSGNPPDMFSYWAGAKVQALVNDDYLAPIDHVWAEAGLDTVFGPSLGAACTYDDHKYALPLTQHYAAFFYNKKVFAAHGVKPPTTWDELLAVCEKLKKAGVTPLALGSRERWPAQFWFDYLLLRMAGPGYRQKLMDGKAHYTDPEVKRAFTLWKQLLDQGWFNKQPELLDWAEASGLVQSGQAAMTLMGTWIIGHFESLGWKQDEDYGVFRFPVVDPAVPMTAVGPIDVIVVPREGDPKRVNAVLAYFSDPGPQMEMSRGSGALAPSRAIPASFYSPMQGRILDIIRSTEHWAFNYDLATPPEVAGFGLEAFEQFLAKPANFSRVLDELNKRAHNSFSKMTP